MRLAVVAQDFPPAIGGIQTYSLELARHLTTQVAQLVVVAPRQPGAESLDRELPFEVVRIPGSDELFPLSSAPAQLRLAQRGFNVFLHTHWASAALFLGVGPGLKGTATCISAHGRELLLRPWCRILGAQPAYDALRRRVFQRAERILPVSHYTAGLVEALGVPGSRITTIPNGTDPERFFPRDASPVRQRLGLGAPDSAPILVALCRLVPRKGVDRLIEAMPQILAQHPKAVLVVVGDGPDRGRLEALTNHHLLNAAVRFTGRVPYDELPLWYSLGDVVVLPSRIQGHDVEGFGIVFLEASACARPVVGPNCGGPRDAIVDGETGLCVDPESPAAIAHAVSSLLADPARALAMGARGRTRVVEQMTWERVSGRVLAALQQAQGDAHLEE